MKDIDNYTEHLIEISGKLGSINQRLDSLEDKYDHLNKKIDKSNKQMNKVKESTSIFRSMLDNPIQTIISFINLSAIVTAGVVLLLIRWGVV